MTENLPQNVEKTLQILAERFGTTVEHLWTVAVQQAYVDAVAAMLLILAVSAGAYFALKWCKKAFEEEDDSSMGEKRMFAGILACIVLGILAGVVLSNIGNLLQVFNPEFYAVKLLLSTLK